MIPEVDDALCQLLSRGLPEGTSVRLDPPKPTWQTERPSKVIDLFLFGLRDDPRGREAGWTDTRDERGAVIARQPAARRCVLSYLITARAPKVGEEHLLLDLALRTMLFTDTIPPDCLTGTLTEAPVGLSIAEHLPGDLWSSLGMPARAAFVAEVSAPYVPEPETDVAPPAEKLSLRSNQDVPSGSLAPAGGRRWVRT